MSPQEIVEKVEVLQNVMIASVSEGTSDDDTYKSLREELLANPDLLVSRNWK